MGTPRMLVSSPCKSELGYTESQGAETGCGRQTTYPQPLERAEHLAKHPPKHLVEKGQHHLQANFTAANHLNKQFISVFSLVLI